MPLSTNRANKRCRLLYIASVVTLIVSFVGSSLYIPLDLLDTNNEPTGLLFGYEPPVEGYPSGSSFVIKLSPKLRAEERYF